ncbi:MAG: hypothetical protein AB1468_01680 [Candidatus Micrarchaeota archaeon]
MERWYNDRRIQILVLIVAGALLLAAVRGIRFGIEFEGGTRIPITFEEPVDTTTMNDIINTIKTRVTKFGLTQVVVKGIGDREVYVEVAKGDSRLVEDIERIVREQGKFEGVVDGRIVLTDQSILPGSIQPSEPITIGEEVQWRVSFAINLDAAKRFASLVKGKAEYPVYMFLDRPEDAILILTTDELTGGEELTETEALSALQDLLRRENETTPIFILKNWDDLKSQLAAKNYTDKKVIISENTSADILRELNETFNLTVITKSEEDMRPLIQARDEKISVNRWNAVGLRSAPVLTPGVTEGQVLQSFEISGPAQGATYYDRISFAQNETRELKSILSGGALPVRVVVGSTTTIPAPLGAEFLRYSVIGALAALFAIVLLVSVRYRTPKVIIPIVLISIAEIIILVAIVGSFTIDLSAMAGIIAALGTSVDAQIVVTDELLKRDTAAAGEGSAKRKLEKAFFIIVTNAIVATVALIPLLFSGLVEIIGFATSTILGVTLGVLITRPAYGAIIERLFEKEERA